MMRLRMNEQKEIEGLPCAEALRKCEGAQGLICLGRKALRGASRRVRLVAGEACAQGTTEYAILVGVLVVIAIAAIVLFRDKVSELWEAISAGINSL